MRGFSPIFTVFPGANDLVEIPEFRSIFEIISSLFQDSLGSLSRRSRLSPDILSPLSYSYSTYSTYSTYFYLLLPTLPTLPTSTLPTSTYPTYLLLPTLPTCLPAGQLQDNCTREPLSSWKGGHYHETPNTRKH